MALDDDVVAARRLSGGDVAESYRMTLASGAEVFAKTRQGAAQDFFDTEARGLTWLREADAVAVPEVLAVDDAMLVLSWIDEGSAVPTTDDDFGRRLAVLHRSGAPAFGRADRRTTGSRRLPNEPCANWPEFYATNRLLPLARLAADSKALTPAAVDRLERVAERLDGVGASDEAPARLHGDLWAGNRLVDRDGVNWLIDPAAHGGHREFDLAMMSLFGGFSDESLGAYHEVYPLADGWEKRVPLHQLAPLVVHAIKFGGGYSGATERALDLLDGL